MKPPIVICAFGTTAKSITTYQHIDKIIKIHFDNYKISWSFSSRTITQQLQCHWKKKIQPPAELFTKLESQGHKNAIVQSLHLFPGTEFDRLNRATQDAELNCTLGSPLITSPLDYHEISQILLPLIATDPREATLILGHGTHHPAWTAYYCLESFLRRQSGHHIFVGTVEKYPDSKMLVEEIHLAGYKKVRIIPFFLVAGMHYKRDITGNSDSSWKNRFSKKGIETKTIGNGLGMLSGFENIIIRHIETAIATFSQINS